MRSTQFDEHFRFEEGVEEHRVRNQPDTLSEATKRIPQVTPYGEVDWLSDPVSAGGKPVLVDAMKRKAGQARRFSIPPSIIRVTGTKRRAG